MRSLAAVEKSRRRPVQSAGKRGNEVLVETLLLDKQDGVATITLNRPKKRNAMSSRLHEDMTAMLEQLRYDKQVRVLVLTGAGQAFCAGMDLKELFTELKTKPEEYDRITRLAVEWRGRTLRYYPKPTIAMVNGFCFGGAFSIVEGCDLAIAAEDATFALSEVNSQIVPRRIGQQISCQPLAAA